MRPLTPETVQLVRDFAPDFLSTLLKRRREQAKTKRKLLLPLPLEVFDDDPMLLYACLWCAASVGVNVTVRATFPLDERSVRLVERLAKRGPEPC